MPSHPFCTRLTIVLAVSILLVLPFPAQIVRAGSTWHEGPTEFENGTMENVSCDYGGLALDKTIGSNWMLQSSGNPWPREMSAMAYDSAHGEIVVFGGSNGWATIIGDTWKYNLTVNEWTNMYPPISPPVGADNDMAYDSENGEFVLFCGETNSSYVTTTWTYNLSDNKWTNMNPLNSPSPREGFAIIYDAAFHEMVLFGGYRNGYGFFCDTWTYDLITNTWANKNPPVAPSARQHFGMAYDSISDEVVLFGGEGNNTYHLNDTWVYNLTTNSWTNMNPQTIPQAESNHALIYDSASDEMVLFGIGDQPYYSLNETWTYNLNINNWTSKASLIAPSLRYHYNTIYDSAHDKIVLFGGSPDPSYSGMNDIWAYDLNTNVWMNESPPLSPSARDWCAMAFDSANGEALLFGGQNNVEYGDSWDYNTSTNKWTDLNPSTAPIKRAGYAMAYDNMNDKVVLFGGWTEFYPLCDTWTYDFKTNNWMNQNPVIAPSARTSCSMVYDTADRKMILFGGTDNENNLLTDTWTYDLTTNKWMNMTPTTSPSTREGFTMAYDIKSGDVILFGGDTFDKSGYSATLDDTWTYNLSGNQWKNMNPSNPPLAKTFHSMAYDSAHDEVILFGGWGNNGSSSDDTWTYNITTNKWTEVNPSTIPPARTESAMVYDDIHNDIILFGGIRYEYYYADTWTYKTDNYYRTVGNYTSLPHDTGGNAYFGIISWNAEIFTDTRLLFQFRSADTLENLSAKDFLGPDGTINSYYDTSGQQISPNNNGSQWFQYRAYFSTNKLTFTPELYSITVSYNLIHSVKVLSPIGGENWTGFHNVLWTANDKDNDSLLFDIFLENVSISIPLALNLPDGTSNLLWNASLVPNGTYHIRIVAKDNNPLIPLTVTALSNNFTVFNPPPPPPNHPPHVWLIAPLNNSIVNTTSIRLVWLGTDPENDPLNFTVSYASHPFSNGMVFQNVIALDYLDLTNLTDNTTYYWTIDASDGINNHTDVPAGIWSFTIYLPHINHPPKITSTPPTFAILGIEFFYNVTAKDPDNDPLTFSLNSPPAEMSIDSFLGVISWSPSIAGTYPITVMVSDGHGGSDNQTFTLVVSPALRPTCTITYPVNGSIVSDAINITGSAAKGTFLLERVEVRIDSGDWMQATGLESWKYVLYTRTLTNGQHTITARAFGGQLYSDNASVTITVNNAPVVPPPNHPITIDQSLWSLLLMIIIAVGVVVVLLFRSRRGFTG